MQPAQGSSMDINTKQLQDIENAAMNVLEPKMCAVIIAFSKMFSRLNPPPQELFVRTMPKIWNLAINAGCKDEVTKLL